MQMTSFISEVFFGEAFENGQVTDFSDQEILLMLKQPDFLSITISEEGWNLLLSYPNEMLPSDAYVGALYSKANENGDIKGLSAQMDNVLKLFSAIQKACTVEEVASLRINEYKRAISSIFAKFSNEEWSLFESITSIEIKKEDYVQIAKAFYGEQFDVYSSNVQTVSLEELKNAAGSAEFFEKLTGYVAAICPAFSYGVTL